MVPSPEPLPESLLSVVIPTLDEARALPALLDDLRAVDVPYEVVVADGGSGDGTRAIARDAGARVVEVPAGRGAQLAAGAAAARGTTLCFLHADVRLPSSTCAALARVADLPDGVAIAFRLHIAADGWRYRFVEWGTDRRSRWGRLPYGDQGLVLTRASYERSGGFAPLPLMEDVALVRRLRALGDVRILPECVHVSPRRWERDGVLRRMLRNWLLVTAYLAGVPPERLARAYRPYSGAAAG